MVIIGGLGSLIGCFMGAALLNIVPPHPQIRLSGHWHSRIGSRNGRAHQLFLVGSLIIFFLIVEPHGLARLWQIIEAETPRTWPFPY